MTKEELERADIVSQLIFKKYDTNTINWAKDGLTIDIDNGSKNTIKINVSDFDADVNKEISKRKLNRDLAKIETLFAKKATDLLKLVYSKRLTDDGIKAQTRMDELYRYAVNNGIVDSQISEQQKDSIAITVKFNSLLMGVCDKITEMATNGEDWQPLYDAASQINLSYLDLTDDKLSELSSYFLGDS